MRVERWESVLPLRLEQPPRVPQAQLWSVPSSSRARDLVLGFPAFMGDPVLGFGILLHSANEPTLSSQVHGWSSKGDGLRMRKNLGPLGTNTDKGPFSVGRKRTERGTLQRAELGKVAKVGSGGCPRTEERQGQGEGESGSVGPSSPEPSRTVGLLLPHIHGAPSAGAFSSLPLTRLLGFTFELRDPRNKFSNSVHPFTLIPLLGRQLRDDWVQSVCVSCP